MSLDKLRCGIYFKLQTTQISVKLIYYKMQKNIRSKSQIIDDDSEFRIQELQNLALETTRINPKEYQIVSIIGSQSSGKSTLLNSLFGTDFQVLNRKQRVGQTTKGIWFSVDSSANIVILDVEGSDSNERQQRTKVERKNSLFAFAISHTLIINIWIQQIGTFKGSQLEILQVILELNLKLFGNQKPKQIIFVVRDFVEKKQNPEALKQKLIFKVKDAWAKIPKPADKSHVQLQDVFQLTVFFLPSKLQEREKQNFQKGVRNLREHLGNSTKNKDLVRDNIPITDLPRYMQNIWNTIEADKDINLPRQKVLLSNMRCQEIKKRIFENYVEQFRDEMEKSERAINLDFGAHIRGIVDKIFAEYDRETVGYIQSEVQRIRGQLSKEIDDRIQESFYKQANMFSDICLRQFTQTAGRIFGKGKNIEEIKAEKPKTIQIFSQNISKISYKTEWAQQRIDKFDSQLDKKFENLKDKILTDSVKEFDRILKKQMENAVSNAFYEKQTFTNRFWEALQQELNKVNHKSKNSILSLFTKLQIGAKKEGRDAKIKFLADKASQYARQELRNFVKMKCIDLKYFIMKHFEHEFNNENDIPRQWSSLKQQDIHKMFEALKKQYIKLLDNFKFFGIESVKSKQKPDFSSRLSAIQKSEGDDSETLITLKDQVATLKKLQQEMGKVLEQALRKNKQTYSASIPTWAYVVLGIAALDDVLLWFTSPFFAIPLTIVLLLVVLAFVFGGKALTDKLFGAVKSATENAVANVTRSAASSILKKSN